MAFYHDMNNKKRISPRNRSYGEEEGSRYRTRTDEKQPGKMRTNSAREESSGMFRSEHRNPAYTSNEKKRSNFHRPGKIVEPPVENHRKSFQDFEYRQSQIPSVERKAYEDREEKYILTGRNPIREALKNHRDLEKLLVQKGELSGSAAEIVQRAKEQKVMIQTVEKSRLDEIASQHQGLIAFASAYQYATVEDILNEAKEKGENPFIVILDGVTDPHNLGAIIRSADCTGAHGVIVPQHRSVGLTPAAVKASAGAVEYVKVARVTNLNRTIEDLQKRNIWVYALTMEGTDVTQVDFSGGTALVIGAEGDGISQLTQNKCDMRVSIPMKGHLDSLNASVAAGIVMHHVMSYR